MKTLVHNYQQLDHNQKTTTKPAHRSLVSILKEELNIQDQIDLGLIRNPIVDPQNQINQIKQELEFYDDVQDEMGINYQGSLLANDEPTQYELEHALDDTTKLKEELIPETKRNNFRVIESQRNNKG